MGTIEPLRENANKNLLELIDPRRRGPPLPCSHCMVSHSVIGLVAFFIQDTRVIIFTSSQSMCRVCGLRHPGEVEPVCAIVLDAMVATALSIYY